MTKFKGYFLIQASLSSWTLNLAHLGIPPEKLKALQEEFTQSWTDLMQSGSAVQELLAKDRRFATPAWEQNALAGWVAASYLVNARCLMHLAEAVEGDEKSKNRLRFAVEQWIAASAPSNFLNLNAEAQHKAIESSGKSIAQGIQNLLHDMQQGHVSMTDESQFEVGRNVATTEGAVVFENELFQLLEYKPLGAKVFEKPLLMVPPCINKFYILDLQPANSFIRYAVEQGHRTFVISWRNPDESLAHKTWDDYIEDAVIRAIEAVQSICGVESANALGFCVGGTLLGTALAVLAARGEKPVASATLLTTFLDFSDTGVLDVFIDEASVKVRETEFAQGGLMQGRDLASTFSFLRPNELVWNYVVGNYLNGQTPPPFDLLYWNSDSTHLPGPFYAWYLRNTYLENRLSQPGQLTVCGEKIDLGKLNFPVYVYGSREDHIVPVGGAYATTGLLSGPMRFVMGASGHIAGVINPASKNKRSYWVRADGKLPADFQKWFHKAEELPGSWWPDWSAWLKPHSGKLIAAPKTYGNRQFKAIEPAPGRYVKVRI
ncbi:MAG: class I poly(R)-hydroxyalkanoic acid synthase [Betaproteobacteria bacterium]|nr:class I poly(R)-hydroxyalkanoic acid synthase [Betaproteobacteria bacterium]